MLVLFQAVSLRKTLALRLGSVGSFPRLLYSTATQWHCHLPSTCGSQGMSSGHIFPFLAVVGNEKETSSLVSLCIEEESKFRFCSRGSDCLCNSSRATTGQERNVFALYQHLYKFEWKVNSLIKFFCCRRGFCPRLG